MLLSSLGSLVLRSSLGSLVLRSSLGSFVLRSSLGSFLDKIDAVTVEILIVNSRIKNTVDIGTDRRALHE